MLCENIDCIIKYDPNRYMSAIPKCCECHCHLDNVGSAFEASLESLPKFDVRKKTLADIEGMKNLLRVVEDSATENLKPTQSYESTLTWLRGELKNLLETMQIDDRADSNHSPVTKL